MMKQTTWLGVVAVLSVTPAARAQDGADRFGLQGQFAVSAERLFGVTQATATEKDPNGDETTSDYTRISLLSTQFSFYSSVYTTPRIGLDYFVMDGLSLGAALGVFTVSASRESTGNPSRDLPTLDGILLAPRIGYAYMFSDVVGIWPRGGITYVGYGSSDPVDNDEASVHLTALTLEAPLVVSPIPHAGFLFSPFVDVGVGGSAETKDGQTGATTSQDVKQTEYGLEAGMFLYF